MTPGPGRRLGRKGQMLRVYNTLGRQLQEFKPLREGFVGMYVCGPTVYGHCHIGHAKSYVSFDAIVRYLRYIGYRVRYVQNITDVGHLTDDADMGEDKIGKRAREMGLEPMEVAETFTRSYFEDMDALNVLRPDISPRASGHIPEQIELVERLLQTGHAYQVGGNVYFDVASFPDYGKLSGRALDELVQGGRVEARGEKRHPADFALWKEAEPGHIMRWNSPWGVGFPGWHLECSVMCSKYLGETADIHGGGVENVFPHHENEIAQSEAATGKPFVRYWLHNGMVTVEGRKMGKSLGNFITLKDAFAGNPPVTEPVRPLVLRFFVLSSHYRSQLDFSAEALQAAEKGLVRIENTVTRIRRTLAQAAPGEVGRHVARLVAQTGQQFAAEMDNDFNTAGALGVLGTFTREVNRILDGSEPLHRADLDAVLRVYDELGGRVLGIVTEQSGQRLASGIESELIDLLLSVRRELRRARQFELADCIRERLNALGIELKDTADGTTWQVR